MKTCLSCVYLSLHLISISQTSLLWPNNLNLSLFSDGWPQPRIMSCLKVKLSILSAQPTWIHVHMYIYPLFFFFSAAHHHLTPSFNLAGGLPKSQGARKLELMMIETLKLIMLVTLTIMMMVTVLMNMMTVYTVHISRCQNEEDDYLCDRLAASGFCEGRSDSQL